MSKKECFKYNEKQDKTTILIEFQLFKEQLKIIY